MECGHERADDPKCATCQSVPREYLVLDPRRVQARVNGFGVNANILGIQVWMECETSVRRKSVKGHPFQTFQTHGLALLGQVAYHT